MIKKILVVNPFGIGDVLFSTPVLKAIKKKYPDASITYICNRRAEGVLRNNANINDIYIYEKDDYREIWKKSKIKCVKAVYSLIKKIRNDKYDVMIDMSLGYIYSLFLGTLASIPFRIGFNYRDRGMFMSRKVDVDGFKDKHVIEYYLELGKFLGLDPSDKDMELRVLPEDAEWANKFISDRGVAGTDKVCGIVPGCGASWGKNAHYRRWSAWKFVELADYLADKHGYKIIILGSRKESSICLKVQSDMKHEAIQACGKTDLAQLAALMDKCDLIITNDGGPLHMAVALKKKTVSIFGPVDPVVYGPYPLNERHIVITSDDACRPCYKSFKHNECKELNCLKNINVEKVIKAAEMLMGPK